MQTISITEALAEVKLILKRVEKKQEVVLTHTTRFDHLPDPFASDGGTVEMIKRECQSVDDLWARLIRIREAIARANLENQLTVEGRTMSIAAWMAFKRDVKEKAKYFYSSLRDKTTSSMKTLESRPQVFRKDESTDPVLVKVMSNVDLPSVNKQLETLVTIEEKLDGLLSLKNAQIQVTI